MKTIPLTRGLVALVDDTDFERIAAFSWQAIVRRGGQIKAVQRTEYLGGGRLAQRRISIQMHRFLISAPDGAVVDHRDGNPLNNQRCNLRICTTVQNARNQAGKADRKRRAGGYLGVSYCKETGLWKARVRSSERELWLGRHPTAEAAARARDDGAIELFGEFAALNFPVHREAERVAAYLRLVATPAVKP